MATFYGYGLKGRMGCGCCGNCVSKKLVGCSSKGKKKINKNQKAFKTSLRMKVKNELKNYSMPKM